MEYFDNFYCKIKDNLYFVVISKNACTSIKKYILDKKNIKCYDFKLIHDLIGYIENELLTLVKNKNKINGIKFAIYRDPIDRAISSYKHLKYKDFDRNYILNSFDDYIKLCETHLNKNYINCDEHIRRQSDYYKEDDVDYVINIKILNDFLKKFNININIENESPKIPIELSKSQISILKKLYKNDYNILNYKNYISSLDDLKNININI